MYLPFFLDYCLCYSSVIIWDLGGVWLSLFKYLNTLLRSKKTIIKVANLTRQQLVIGLGGEYVGVLQFLCTSFEIIGPSTKNYVWKH